MSFTIRSASRIFSCVVAACLACDLAVAQEIPPEAIGVYSGDRTFVPEPGDYEDMRARVTATAGSYSARMSAHCETETLRVSVVCVAAHPTKVVNSSKGVRIQQKRRWSPAAAYITGYFDRDRSGISLGSTAFCECKKSMLSAAVTRADERMKVSCDLKNCDCEGTIEPEGYLQMARCFEGRSSAVFKFGKSGRLSANLRVQGESKTTPPPDPGSGIIVVGSNGGSN